MQDFICWSFVYENIVALWQWFVHVIYWLFKGANIIDVAQMLASFIIAGATTVLWRATRNLAELNKKKPNVICTMESSFRNKKELKLVIRNVGNAPAFDIEVNIKSDKSQSAGGLFFNSGVSILAPYKGFLPQRAIYHWHEPTKFNIIVSWTSEQNGKKRESLEYIIDYNDYDRFGWHEAGLDQIVEGIANN